MRTYCLVCRKKTDNVNSKMIKTVNYNQNFNVQFVETKQVDLFQKEKAY